MTPELIKNAIDEASKTAKEKKTVVSPKEKMQTVADIIKKFGGNYGEAMSQLPQLGSQLAESAAIEEKGKSASEEFRGGRTHGNLAAGLSEAITDISDKMKKVPGLNTVAALKENTKYLLSDPKTKALIEHPVFQQMYPDFWHRVLKYNDIIDR